MTTTQITALFFLLASPVIGSFLAVLADRLARGEDVVAKPSACRACGTRLKPRDLIPVLSFALTAGRCRKCGAAIPPWLLYMEIATFGLAVVAVSLGQSPVEIALYAGLLWLLLTLAVCDLLWFRLPDVLTGALLALALAIALITGRPRPEMALWGAAIGAGSFLALRLGYRALRGREGLGMGDVKMMAGLGAALGPFNLPLMVLLAALAGLAVALVQARRSADALKSTRALPFGAALAAASAVVWGVMRLPV